MKKMYAAYGSNINLIQMKNRCPSSSVYAVGDIEDMELAFNTHATLHNVKGSSCPAVLYLISQSDEQLLDVFEAYPQKYIKETVRVDVGGKTIIAMAYVMRDKTMQATPSEEYYNRISDGYFTFGLDHNILENAYDKAASYEHNNMQLSFFQGKEESSIMSENKLYVAYGSNLNIKQMKQRCPKSHLICSSELDGYKLHFSRHATIIPDGKSTVECAVWSIHPDDWKRLDAYEGYPSYYRKEKVNVIINNKPATAEVYIMNGNCPAIMPQEHYINIVKQGYIDNKLSLNKLTVCINECRQTSKKEESNYERQWKGNQNIPAASARVGQSRH